MKFYPIVLTLAAQIPLSGFIAGFFILMEYRTALLIQGKSTDEIQGDITFVLIGLVVSIIASIGITVAVWKRRAQRKAKLAAMNDLQEVSS